MGTTLVTAMQVANFFINKALETDVPLDHVKLQKLLYVTYGWHLVQFGRRPFDESLKAWRYGPVVFSVFKEISGTEGNITKGKFLEIDPIRDESVISFLNDIWGKYSRFTISDLVLAKTSGIKPISLSPWERLRIKFVGGNVPVGTELPDEFMTDYFLEKKAMLRGEFNPGNAPVEAG